MERIIETFEEKLANIELEIGTREGGIKARKEYGTRLASEMVDVKRQIKLLCRNGESTKFLAKTRKELVEVIIQNDSILKHLKMSLAELRHDAYCYAKSLENLKN